MQKTRKFSEERKAELLCNPYTAYVTDDRVIHTLSFKKFVMAEIDKHGMTSRKLYKLAGYEDPYFTNNVRNYTIRAIRQEAASEEGLKEPKAPKKKNDARKKYEKERKALEDRIELLEQQVNFLKKSQFLKNQGRSKQTNNSD